MLLFFTIAISCGDNNDLKAVDVARRDSIETYLKLSNSSTSDVAKQFYYTKKAQQLVANEPLDSIKVKYLFQVANRFYNQNKTREYKLTCEDLIHSTIKINDTAKLGKAYNYLGDYYLNANARDTGYYYYLKAEKIFKQLNDVENLTITALSKATILYEAHEFFESEASTLQALNYIKRKYHRRRHYEALTLLALTSCELQEYDKALDYNRMALKIIKNKFTDDPERPFAITMNNLGNVYQRMGNHDYAIRCFRAGLEEKDLLLRNARIYAILLDNLAYSTNQQNKKNELSAKLFSEALRLKALQYDISSVIFTKVRYAEYLYEKGDSIQALRLAREALKSARDNNLLADMLPALKLLIKLEPQNNNQYITSLIKFNDSLVFKERATRNKFARIKYETNELSIQKQIAVKQRWIVAGAAIVIILLILLLLVIQIQRLNKKEMQFQQNQQEANEQIYSLIIDQQSKIDEGRESEKRRISRDLHDGIMNKLTSIRLNLFILNKKSDKSTIEHCINYISQIQDVEKEIRNISHDLNTDILGKEDSFGILLQSFFNEQSEIGNATYFLELDPQINWDILDTTKKVNLYRILQEIFSNITKHSMTTCVEIVIRRLPRAVEILISDNGIGFSKSDYKKGIGIRNIKSRIKIIKGKVEFQHTKSQGTKIKLLIPI